MAPRLSLCSEWDVDCCPPTELLLMGVFVAVSTQPTLPECEGECPDVVSDLLLELGVFDVVCVFGLLDEGLCGWEERNGCPDLWCVFVACGVSVVVCEVVVTVVKVVLCTVVIVIVVLIILSRTLERCRSRGKGGLPRLGVGAASTPTTKKARRVATQTIN